MTAGSRGEGRIIRTWNDVQDLMEGFRQGQWVFRGADESGRRLQSSLERLALDRWGHPPEDLPEIEEGLLRRFKREASRYLSHVPADSDWIGWLGLMRHHGAPTRLLDWTHSLFVALHFALSKAEPEGECSVWAADLDWIYDRTRGPSGVLPEDAQAAIAQDPNAVRPETIDLIVRRTPRVPLLYPLSPFTLHERLVLQQGIFLVPGDVTLSSVRNLEALGPFHDKVQELRIHASRGFLRAATQELSRMNVSEATLFPGLDGFARQLANIIPFPELRTTDRPRKPAG